MAAPTCISALWGAEGAQFKSNLGNLKTQWDTISKVKDGLGMYCEGLMFNP